MELSEIIGVDAVRAPLKATSKKRLLQDLADMAEAVYAPAVGDRLSGADGPRGAGADRRRARGGDPARPLRRGEPRARPLRAAGEAGGLRVRSTASRSIWSSRSSRPESAGAEHLKALARVSRTLRSEAVCSKLRSTFDPSALYAILTDGKAEQAA